MFDRILIPTDGSAAVRPAVETAINLADIHNAVLHVLYIVNQPAAVSGTGEGVPGLDNLLNALEKTGHETTTVVADQAADRGIDARTAVRRGNPHDDILAYATEHDIDLIVMGTHGRTGVRRALLGSVTENVVRHAENPVLTVRREPET
ncbi:universal stress protein [Halocatena pleomorpha]|uniref:Universal stress protein n=1 Tax=Halocatena pleomorpha TaxID=1785090 RepID=A0A3P3RG65_9EURY|nr:universal stress protein [Halocatena pleomorpha]RRJ31423.1 universal stress protein [Halocatena pleomorpha]